MAVATCGGGKTTVGEVELHDAIGQSCGGTASSTHYAVADGFYQTVSFPPVQIKTPYLDNNVNPTHSIQADELLASCRDPEGGLLVLDAVESHSTSGIEITWSQASVYYAFSDGQSGPDWFKFTVRNEAGDRASFSVLVMNLPVIMSQPDQSIEPNQNLYIPNMVSPPSGEPLDFVLIAAPSGMGIDLDSGAIVWTPTFYQGGTSNRVVVQVSTRDFPPLTDYFSFAVLVPRRPIPAGDTTWAGGGTLSVEMDDATGAAGVMPGWDLLVIDGNLELQASASDPFTIKLVSIDGTGAGRVNHFTNTVAYTWTIATTSGGMSGFTPLSFVVDTSEFANFTGGGSFSVQQSGNAVNLVFTPHACTLSETTRGSKVVAGNMVLYFTNRYGFSAVEGLTLRNCTMTGLAYGPGWEGGTNVGSITLSHKLTLPEGTTNLTIVGVKVDAGQSATVNARVYDACGNGSQFDPVLAQVVAGEGGWVRQAYSDLPAAEHFVSLANGRPGLSRLKVVVNGLTYDLNPLAADQSLVLDVRAAIHEGEQNTIILLGWGDPGASAEVWISDRASGIPVVLAAKVDSPAISISRSGNQVVLAWPAPAYFFVLEASAGLETSTLWQTVPTAQEEAEGVTTVKLSLQQGMSIFRLRQ